MLKNNTEECCYQLLEDGSPVAVAAYALQDDVLTMTHTEVDPTCEGRGYGARLARFALEDARQRGLRVVPVCAFIAGYIARHPEYASLTGDGAG